MTDNGRDDRVAEYVAALLKSRFGPQVALHRCLEGTGPRFAAPGAVDPRLAPALAAVGVRRLYSHQAEAVAAVRAGRDVIVATPTASGKTLVYNIPVFERFLDDRESRALYLFPLKALARDQMRAAEAMAAALAPGPAPAAGVFDGDTTAHFRRRIRTDPPGILFTNPDMLHLSILPGHEAWAGFLGRLRTVVVDEVHTYRGVFGSHVAWVLRRLVRLCRLYGSDPVFVMSSATVGNPGGLARALVGRDPVTVTESGAPAGRRHVLVLDPLDGVAGTSCRLLDAAVRRGLRVIVYTGSRRMTELVGMWAESRLPPELAGRVRAYRAGYLPGDRREIEAKMASGELLAVVATSALELGIDIGGLDVCILAGYPGSMMSARQRAGRVGRRGRQSAVILVAGDDALDKYFVRHPREFIERPVEDAVLDPDNQAVSGPHLLCAAAEHPLEADEDIARGRRAVLERLARGGSLLEEAAGGRFHAARKRPHRLVDLRGGAGEVDIVLAPSGEVAGTVDRGRVFRECHPGAVHLHRGDTLLVEALDLDAGEVRARRCRLSWYTRPETRKHTAIVETVRRVRPRAGRRWFPFAAGLGRLRVTEQVTGYRKIAARGGRTISVHALDLPPQVFETEGLWIEIPAELHRELVEARQHFMGAIHALEHAMIGVMPLLVTCDRNDLGGISTPCHPQTGAAAVFVYDGRGGGAGLCRRAFADLVGLLELTLEAVAGCDCGMGCPSCVHSPKCGSGNRPMDKQGCLALLRGLLKPSARAGRVAVTAPAAPRAAGPETAAPPHFCVFDLETKRSAAEVGGWHRADRMGVSLGVVYDSREDRFVTFREREMEALVDRLFSCDLVVGFNNLGFDNRVLSAYTDRDLAGLPALDILHEVRTRLGYRLSLDRVAEHTLGAKKSACGLDALRWYAEGRFDLIEKYCARDVEITRDLYLFGLDNGFLLFANKAGEVVRCPVDFGMRGRGARRTRS